MPQNQETYVYTKGDPYIISRGSTSNEYIIDQFGPGFFDGQQITVKVHQTNTGAATINAIGKGTVPLVSNDGSALLAGVLQAGQFINARYNIDTNSFHVLNSTGGASGITGGVSTGSGADVYNGVAGSVMQFRSLVGLGTGVKEGSGPSPQIELRSGVCLIGNSVSVSDGLAYSDNLGLQINYFKNIKINSTNSYNAGAGFSCIGITAQDHILTIEGGYTGDTYDIIFDSNTGTVGAPYITVGQTPIVFRNLHFYIGLNPTHNIFIGGSTATNVPVIFQNCRFSVAASMGALQPEGYLFNLDKNSNSGCINCTFEFLNTGGKQVILSNNNVAHTIPGTETPYGFMFDKCNFRGGNAYIGDSNAGDIIISNSTYETTTGGGAGHATFINSRMIFAGGTLQNRPLSTGWTFFNFINSDLKVDPSCTTTNVTLIQFDGLANSNISVKDRNINLYNLVDNIPNAIVFSNNRISTTGSITIDGVSQCGIENSLIICSSNLDINAPCRLIHNTITCTGIDMITNNLLDGNRFTATTDIIAGTNNNILVNNINLGDVSVLAAGTNNIIANNN